MMRNLKNVERSTSGFLLSHEQRARPRCVIVCAGSGQHRSAVVVAPRCPRRGAGYPAPCSDFVHVARNLGVLSRPSDAAFLAPGPDPATFVDEPWMCRLSFQRVGHGARLTFYSISAAGQPAPPLDHPAPGARLGPATGPIQCMEPRRRYQAAASLSADSFPNARGGVIQSTITRSHNLFERAPIPAFL